MSSMPVCSPPVSPAMPPFTGIAPNAGLACPAPKIGCETGPVVATVPNPELAGVPTFAENWNIPPDVDVPAPAPDKPNANGASSAFDVLRLKGEFGAGLAPNDEPKAGAVEA